MLNMYTVLIPEINYLYLSLCLNKQKTHPNSLKESLFGYFSENLGLFRFVSVCCETDLFVSVVWYRFETPKQTEMFCFWFHETNWNKRETNLVSVCFGLFRFVPKIIFVCFEDTLPWMQKSASVTWCVWKKNLDNYLKRCLWVLCLREISAQP